MFDLVCPSLLPIVTTTYSLPPSLIPLSPPRVSWKPLGEAVYGVARVLQEAGDHSSSRELLLYLGERSQEISSVDDASSVISSGVSTAGGGGRSRGVGKWHGRANSPQQGYRSTALCFPLDDGDRSDVSCSFPWGLENSVVGPGKLSEKNTACARSVTSATALLPAALEEVMWRVARASIRGLDWDTSILALKGLAAWSVDNR